MQELENRIKRLEKKCLMWRWVAVALTVILGAATWLSFGKPFAAQAAAQPGQPGEVEDYFVQQESSRDDMAKAIRTRIKDDWELLGGVTVTHESRPIGGDSYYYYQALVKRKK